MIHETAARGFARAVEAYERGRAGYPEAAVSLVARELGIGPGRVVVDLAAGTGKLTRSIVPLGARVVAIEPLAEMRGRLARLMPSVDVLSGTAEAMPLPDATADVVVVGQAFHWFDARVAAAEIHRVLVGGGGLAVLNNAFDYSVAWVAAMQEIVTSHAGETPRHDTSPWREELETTELFAPVQSATFPHPVASDLDGMLARVASVSYISALPDSTRAEVIAGVREIVATEAGAAAPGAPLVVPYVTRVWWCRAA